MARDSHLYNHDTLKLLEGELQSCRQMVAYFESKGNGLAKQHWMRQCDAVRGHILMYAQKMTEFADLRPDSIPARHCYAIAREAIELAQS